MTVAVLYAQAGGSYAARPGVHVYDHVRDARSYPGPWPVVAHPPCRAWGRYKHVSKHTPDERNLAYHALACVRAYGGVLEHPNGGSFWKDALLPRPGEPPDQWGYTILVNQCDWGHRALKPTLLYIVGVPYPLLPSRPPPGRSTVPVERMWRGEREATPALFGDFLLAIAAAAARS